MLALGLLVAVWFYVRMPETLHPEHRMPLSASRILGGIRLTLTTRVAIGYATAVGLIFGTLMGYVGSAQQIFETEVYGLGPWFPLAFGSIAAVMGVAAILNAHLVRRYGMRRLAHGSLLAFCVVSLLQVTVALAYGGRPPLVLFGMILASNQFLASLAFPNFNAMAMDPLGAVAGTASSFMGFYTTLGAALLGLVIGQAFDGTVLPLGIGYAVLSALAVGVVLWTERGRLFQPQHEPRVRTG
jgi:DHA1 family bicyclomycin/chloramphenicol resistance-like MFS transporter